MKKTNNQPTVPHDFKFEGVSFVPRTIAKQDVETFVKNHKGKYWPKADNEEEMLRQVHATATELVGITKQDDKKTAKPPKPAQPAEGETKK